MTFELIGFCAGNPGDDGIEPVRLCPAGDWTACLIDSPRWRRAVLKRIALRRAVHRQEALEALLEFGAVVPVAPGALVRPDELPQIAAANGDTLTKAFGACAGRVQYEVEVGWAEDKVLTAFRHAPEIAPLFRAASVDPEDIAKRVEALRTRLAEEIGALLTPVASETVTLSRRSGTVARFALLISRTAHAAFEKAVEAVDALWTEGFRVRQIGPAPAAAFGTLLFRRPSREELPKAAARLGLPNTWKGEDLRLARRRALLAAQAPDAAQEVREAYRLLAGWDAVGRPSTPPPVLDLWREGQAIPKPAQEAVA